MDQLIKLTPTRWTRRAIRLGDHRLNYQLKVSLFERLSGKDFRMVELGEDLQMRYPPKTTFAFNGIPNWMMHSLSLNYLRCIIWKFRNSNLRISKLEHCLIAELITLIVCILVCILPVFSPLDSLQMVLGLPLFSSNTTNGEGLNYRDSLLESPY